MQSLLLWMPYRAFAHWHWGLHSRSSPYFITRYRYILYTLALTLSPTQAADQEKMCIFPGLGLAGLPHNHGVRRRGGRLAQQPVEATNKRVDKKSGNETRSTAVNAAPPVAFAKSTDGPDDLGAGPKNDCDTFVRRVGGDAVVRRVTLGRAHNMGHLEDNSITREYRFFHLLEGGRAGIYWVLMSTTPTHRGYACRSRGVTPDVELWQLKTDTRSPFA